MTQPKAQFNLFTRQKALIGQDGQDRLAEASVLIVGLGGLGSNVAELLARMGVGKLILIDGDDVADHNLGRQRMYITDDIGVKKVVAAKEMIEAINPDCEVVVHDVMLDEHNATLTLLSADKPTLIVDCVDTHATRRVIDSFCSDAHIPWIHGAAIEDKGSVVFFHPQLRPEVTYGSIYQSTAKDQHCEITGVLGTITALVGTLQAQLVFDYIVNKNWPKEMIRVSLGGLEFMKIRLS